MQNEIQPLKANGFLAAAMEYMDSLKGTYIYDAKKRDYLQKTIYGNVEYGPWLNSILTYITDNYRLDVPPHILDFGCGTGELTVLINHLGYDATGVDIHEAHLKLAKILANENGINDSIFILNKDKKLPFADKSFDIITMFVVLEHLGDDDLKYILPELKRVCKGALYVLVPNKLQITDDHTGLHFLPWMPRWLATLYLKLRGRKHQYFISNNGSWDVHYRGLLRIKSLFNKHGFDLDFPPDSKIFPPLNVAPPISRVGKSIMFGKLSFFLGVPFPHRFMIKSGYPKQAFYPYLNLIFIPKQPESAV
ncbi:MAG: class I SAM-dependent methyltransferase [Candidatus Omnitrophica bacterium]|nr:class I SAM-dependent methyltransferase [Candidatus Omnitrophota bacterium]